MASTFAMSGQLPAPGRPAPPGTPGIPPPQFAMNGALRPAKTTGHEIRRKIVRVIFSLPPRDLKGAPAP
jgi:hypothetical protein